MGELKPHSISSVYVKLNEHVCITLVLVKKIKKNDKLVMKLINTYIFSLDEIFYKEDIHPCGIVVSKSCIISDHYALKIQLCQLC